MPRSLGEILVRAKAVTPRQLEEALSNQVVYGGRLGTSLLELGYISEAKLANYLSAQWGLPTIEPQAYVKIHKSISKMLPKALAERTLSVPMVFRDKILHLLMADPGNVAVQDEIRFATGAKKLQVYVAPEVRLYFLLHKLYGTKRDVRYISFDMGAQGEFISSAAPPKVDNTAPIKSKKVLTVSGLEDSGHTGDLMSEETFSDMVQDVGMGAAQPAAPLFEADGLQSVADAATDEDDILLGDVADDEEELLILGDELPVESPLAQPEVPAAISQPAHVPAVKVSASDEQIEAFRKLAPESIPVRRLTLQQASKALANVEDRDQIARVVLGFASGTFKRCALFMVRPDLVMGWDGTGEQISRDTVERLMIPLNSPSVFKLVYDMRAHFLGALPKTPVNTRFMKALGGEPPLSAFVIPIVFKGKVVNILYGDNGPGAAATFDIGELLILAMKIPQSFEALLARRKIAGQNQT